MLEECCYSHLFYPSGIFGVSPITHAQDPPKKWWHNTRVFRSFLSQTLNASFWLPRPLTLSAVHRNVNKILTVPLTHTICFWRRRIFRHKGRRYELNGMIDAEIGVYRRRIKIPTGYRIIDKTHIRREYDDTKKTTNKTISCQNVDHSIIFREILKK